MKSILTKLTESVGDVIANNTNNNILEKLHINDDTKPIKRDKNIDYSNLDFEKFMDILWDDSIGLAYEIEKYIKDNKKTINRKCTKKSSRYSSGYSSGSCGSGGRSSGSCGSGGSSSYSRGSGSCGGGGRPRAAC